MGYLGGLEMLRKGGTVVDLHSLMKRLAVSEHALLGTGPRHPVAPNPEIADEVERFLAQYPFLRQDQGYVDFLECYAGASFDCPDASLIVFIYGFLDQVTRHFTKDEPFVGSAVDEERGFLVFAEMVFRPGKYRGVVDNVSYGYAFDMTETRRWGVYHDISSKDYTSSKYEWHCESFLQLLEELVGRVERTLKP